MDKTRAKHFVDAFAASILGNVAYDGLKSAWRAHSENEAKTVRIFQRALIIAVEAGAVEPDVADKYLARVAELPASRRLEYITKIMQPPSGEPDARQTAVVIRDHAHMSEPAWRSLATILNVTQATAAELRAEEFERETDRLEAELRRRRNCGPLKRFWNGLTGAFKLP